MSNNTSLAQMSQEPFSIKDIHSLRFVAQFVFSSVLMVVCIYGLFFAKTTDHQNNDALYWGGLTGIIAWWMPSPGGSTSKNQANFGEGNKVIGVENNLPTSSESKEFYSPEKNNGTTNVTLGKIISEPSSN